MPTPLSKLSESQRDLLASWLPNFIVLHDHSWGLVDNVVLEVESAHQRYIVKADGASTNHIGRELEAHEKWLAPWVDLGRAPRLVAGDRSAGILVTEYRPGQLVLDSPAQEDPETFRQAGELLAMLHGQPSRVDPSYEAQESEKILHNLDKQHRIGPCVEARLREIISSWRSEPVVLAPAHGDWQPRNWLVHEGQISVIDFGRAALRPTMSDWLRLEARDFRDDPARERAFIQGYGADPRESVAWFRERLREAINTAVWAYSIGDDGFEMQGHAMIERVLTEA